MNDGGLPRFLYMVEGLHPGGHLDALVDVAVAGGAQAFDLPDGFRAQWSIDTAGRLTGETGPPTLTSVFGALDKARDLLDTFAETTWFADLPEDLTAGLQDIHGRIVACLEAPADDNLATVPSPPAAERLPLDQWRLDEWMVEIRTRDLSVPDVLKAWRAKVTKAGLEAPNGIRAATGNLCFAELLAQVIGDLSADTPGTEPF